MRITALLSFLLLLLSCQKERFTTDPSFLLTTSEDTLHFDTVFTTAGSTTQYFKILNPNNRGIRIASVQLAGGAGSPFRINADGLEGPVARNIEIAGNDSAYVFVTVRIDPSSANLPFVVRDSILIDYNGNTRKIQLEAYGQNANFLRSHVVQGTENWSSSLPYVILGGLGVAQGAVLNIQKGSRIYLHADAPVVVAGTLNVLGEKWDSTRVRFTGDRLDAPYRDFPASWPGIVFTETSHGNRISFARIQNAFQGLQVLGAAPGTAPKLVLEETVIDNAYDAGILAVGSSIRARNLLLSNCGKGVQLVQGGDYLLEHCTITAYPNSYYQRKDPLLLISDNAENNTAATFPLQAVFRNCIFWAESGGLVPEEVVLRRKGNLAYQASFEGVLWPLPAAPARATVTAPALREDPQFVAADPGKKIYDFRLKESSPALNKGVVSGVPLDLDGNPRPVGIPDLGAYEKQ